MFPMGAGSANPSTVTNRPASVQIASAATESLAAPFAPLVFVLSAAACGEKRSRRTANTTTEAIQGNPRALRKNISDLFIAPPTAGLPQRLHNPRECSNMHLHLSSS